MPSASLVLPPTPSTTVQATSSKRGATARLLEGRPATADARDAAPHRQHPSFREALGRAADRNAPRDEAKEPSDAAEDARGDERTESGKADRSAKTKSGKPAKAAPKTRRPGVGSDDAADGVDEASADIANDVATVTDEAGTATDDTDSLRPEEHDHCKVPAAEAHAIDPSAVAAANAAGLATPTTPAATATTTEAPNAVATDANAVNGVAPTGTTASVQAADAAAAKAAGTGEAPEPGEAEATATDQPAPTNTGRPAPARRGPGLGQPAASSRGGSEGVAEDADAPAQPARAVADGTTAFQQFAEMFAPSANGPADAAKPAADGTHGQSAPAVDATAVAPQPQQARETSRPAAPAAAEPPPEARFAADNHERIVDGVRGELLPTGGTMKLKLDPPELGAMQVSLHMKDGVVTASFQTSNDETARLLSHTLSDLRSTLESHGIVVDKLHVQQAPKDEGSSYSQGGDRGSQQRTLEQQGDARREQQRKDMVQRLWDKLAGKGPLDITV